MAISLKDRAELAASIGLQPHEVDIRENPDGSVDVNPARKPATESTGAGTFLRYGLGNAPGAAVGTTTGVAAMETAAPFVNRGAEMLRGIPKIGGIVAPVAKFVGNAATFGTGAAGGKYLAEEKMGLGGVKDLIIGGDKQEALDAAQHPWMMRAGEFVSNFAGQKLPDVKSLASGVPKVATLRRLATDDLGLTTAEAAALQNVGGGAALSAGQEGLREYQAGEELSPGAIAVAGVAGGLFGDARAPFQKAGSGIATGLRSMAGGKPTVAPAPRKTEAEILAEFQGKQAEPTTTTAEQAPVPPSQETTAEIVDPLAKAMAQGREATAKLREAEGIPMPYADRLKATQSELMRNVMLSRPKPAESAPLTTADVMPEAPLTGPSTRDLVQKFLPGKPTGYTQRSARVGEGAGVPRQRDYEFGRGPEDPVQQEFDRLQNELEGRRVRYQEDTEAEANAVGKAIEGLALNANPVMAPAALARGNTTAEPSGWQQHKTRMRAQELAPGVGALERRGFQYKAAEEPIITPEGRRARGAFTPATGEIAIDPTVANATTAKHEGMHAELQDMLLSGNPKLERLATEMVAIAGEEPLAEGGAVASNAAEKTNRLVRLLQDNWNWLRTTKLGGGDQSPERLARVLAERFDFQAPGPVKTGAANAKFQPTDDRPFVSGTEAFLTRGAPGVTFTKDGRVVPESFNAWLSKQPRNEQELMAQAGLGELVARGATADELVAHLRERGPKVEVLDYGMTGKNSPIREQYDRDNHDLETMGYHVDTAGRLMRRGNFNTLDRDNPNVPREAWTLAERIMANHDKVEQDRGLQATRAYNRVSAFPTDEPMPEWTASKLKNNVQRVDVVIPQEAPREDLNVYRIKGSQDGEKYYAPPITTEQYNADKARGIIRVQRMSDNRWVELPADTELVEAFHTRNRDNPPALWQPDNLHENIPNTLGWAMIQYRPGPNGEKVAVIAESQSRWGQEVREKKKIAERYKEGDYRIGEAEKMDHPLLSDYNRLILKAAVEQARKEGATHIVISDAESAMMTEMHDQHAAKKYEVPANAKNVEFAKRLVAEDNINHLWADNINKLARGEALLLDDSRGVVQGLEGFDYNIAYKPEQEGGMRFNYDKAMPKIAEEMLGPGQRVSLGAHKNAMEKATQQDITNYIEQQMIRKERGEISGQEFLKLREDALNFKLPDKPRKNLIFRNPDGSPKTDASGMMYPIDAIATRRAAGEPMTLTGKRYQEMVGPDEFNTVPSSVLDVPDKVVAKAGYDFMADKARIYGATVNTALTDAKKLGGEDMWRRVMEKRSAAFDSGAQPNYTPDELPMAQRIQNMYDEFAVLRNNYGLPGNNAANYTGHLADINVIKKAEADYPAFAAEYLPAYLHYNATQYGPAQKGGFDPVEAAQTFRDYFTGAARAPHSEFGADFGVLTKSARQYGLPPEMRAPYDFRHAIRFGERFTRGLAEKRHLKDNPHVAKMLGLDEGGSPAGEIYRNFRSALAGQLPNQGKTRSFSNAGELYDATRQTVNTAIMQAPTGLWNTLNKLKDYGVVIAQNPSTGVPALMKATQDLFTNFGPLRREAISVDAIRPGQDYIGANENLDVAGNVARNMRNFNTKARMVTGTEAIEQFNRVQDYAFGKRLAEAALAGRRAQDPAAEDFWKRFGAGIDDKMPDDEIIKRAAGNFVRDIQGSYGPEGLPAWLLNSGTPSLLMRLNRFGWENMRRVQRNVVEPARQGNWMPLLTYIGLAGVTAEVRKQIADALLKQPSGLPTAQEIEAAGAEPAVEQMLNLMEMADASGAFGFAGSVMGATAKNARGTKRAVVMDPTISFGWQLAQNLAAAADAMREGEPAAPVIQEVLKRTLLDNIQNLRPLAADRGEAQDRRNKKVFSDLTDRKKVTTGAMLEGLAFGSLTQPGRKIDPTMEAAKAGDQTALRALSPEERRRADNYPGGYEDDKTEADYRRFIESGQGTESLEDYLARRQEYKRRVRPPARIDR